ncbi:helix-turn-helix transcriptional regulator [Pseudoalteromonas sp. A601]|uniref:LuxR C-terminal-related transcriptional regulator n=1 Tax=Pseudoalteromonas sp. A601 TaxID=1967839 RepID=UPI000B3D25F9|nr:LuxR C-terminal-related transcriptional regulator [Pseudoalteromonas sp. A601]OUS73514.1 helix-turn-helix transcriptional regulator [Pseudoalteromonas sp. A601]
MHNDELNIHLADTISALNSPNFTPKLMHVISVLLNFDCSVILGYREGKRPIYLYDSIENKRDLLFQRYLTTSFQSDPFYQKLNANKEQGIFTLKDIVDKDVARNDLDYQAYCEHFYHQTGWKDELSMLIEIEPTRWVILYFGFMENDKRFTKPQLAKLKSYFTIIQSLCQQHWKQTEFTLAEAVFSPAAYSGQLRAAIESALASFGQSVLTKREQEIAALIAQGNDSKEISKQLGVAEGTIKNHRKRIYAQLNVASLSELFQLFLNHLITQSR